MNIIIVSATEIEIDQLIKKIEAKNISKNIYQSIYKNNCIDILISGVGMVSTSYYLTKHLVTANKKYDLAINTGIAGSFDRNIKLGEVVNVVSDIFSDFGAEDGNEFIQFDTLPLTPRQRSVGEVVKKVKGITVNTVHGNEKSIDKIKKQFNPDVESMEGAAFFYCCLAEDTPCIQIRAISNYVERRNKTAWEIELAIKNLNDVILMLVEK